HFTYQLLKGHLVSVVTIQCLKARRRASDIIGLRLDVEFQYKFLAHFGSGEFVDKKIQNLYENEENDNDLEKIALPLVDDTCENGKVCLYHFHHILYFTEPHPQIKVLNQATVKLIKQLVLPHKFRGVKDIDVLHNTILGVQGPANEPHHIPAPDAELACPFQLVGKTFDLR